MKLSEYLRVMLPIIGPKMHIQTVYEYGRAVRRFTAWHGEIDLEDVTLDLIREFEHSSEVASSRKLASNLRSLMRTFDKQKFPARQNKYQANAPGKVARCKAPATAQKCRTLTQFVEWYLAERDAVSTCYRETLRRRMGCLQASVRGDSLQKVLTEAAVNNFLGQLEVGPQTVKSYRSNILAVWRAAADEDLVIYPNARRIKRLKCPPLIVDCYTVHEVSLLVKAAQGYAGNLPGSRIPRKHYWPAIIMAAWDSGLRRGDLWRFKAADIRVDGTALVLQHKVKKVVPCRFRPETVVAIRAVGESLRWPADPRTFGFQFGQLLSASGVRRGSFRWLRRASGSYVESVSPGAGSKHLGNTPQVFSAHYDAKLSAASAPMPPELQLA